MRIVIIFIILLISASFAGATSLPEDRRVEEEKRNDLKSTEAQYYDSSSMKVDKEFTVRDYLDRLASQDSVNYADAAYVIAVLINKTDSVNDDQQRERFFIDHNLLPKKIQKELSFQKPVSRGVFAYMLFRVLGLKGGLTVRIFGPRERYVHKELVYEKIMVSGSVAEYMTGREMVYSFVQAANYIALHKSNN